MKKLKFSFFLCVFALIAISCNKSEESSSSDSNSNTEISISKQNEATWIPSGENSKKWWLILKFCVGHTSEQCGGRCLKFFGENYHADCRGLGNVCNLTSCVEVAEDFTLDEVVLILKDLDLFGSFEIFPFPDRSLMITNPQNNTELWLNIPEQVLYKDSTLQVVFQNVWFSEEPELENE